MRKDLEHSNAFIRSLTEEPMATFASYLETLGNEGVDDAIGDAWGDLGKDEVTAQELANELLKKYKTELPIKEVERLVTLFVDDWVRDLTEYSKIGDTYIYSDVKEDTITETEIEKYIVVNRWNKFGYESEEDKFSFDTLEEAKTKALELFKLFQEQAEDDTHYTIFITDEDGSVLYWLLVGNEYGDKLVTKFGDVYGILFPDGKTYGNEYRTNDDYGDDDGEFDSDILNNVLPRK